MCMAPVKVEDHLDLVEQFAGWFERRVPAGGRAVAGREDLIGQGALGLCEAAAAYSPADGPFEEVARPFVTRQMARIVSRARRPRRTFHLSALAYVDGRERPIGDLGGIVDDDAATQLARRLRYVGEPGASSSIQLKFSERAIVLLRYHHKVTRKAVAGIVGVTPAELSAIEAQILDRLDCGRVSPGYTASVLFTLTSDRVDAKLREALREAEGRPPRSADGKGAADRYRAVDFERRLIFDASHPRIADVATAHGFELVREGRESTKGKWVYAAFLGWSDVELLSARVLASLAGRGDVDSQRLAAVLLEDGRRLCLPSPEVSYKSVLAAMVPLRKRGYVESRRFGFGAAAGAMHRITDAALAARRRCPVWPVLAGDLDRPQFAGFRHVKPATKRTEVERWSGSKSI